MTNMFLNNVLGMKMYFFFFNNIFLGKSTASVAFFLMSIFCCRSLSFWFIFFNTLLALLLKSSLQVSWYLTSFATKSIFYILAKRAVSSTILAFRIIPSCTLVVMHFTRWSFFPTFFWCLFHKTDRVGGTHHFCWLILVWQNIFFLSSVPVILQAMCVGQSSSLINLLLDEPS